MMTWKELCRWCWDVRRGHGLSQEGLGAVKKHICPSILELGKTLVAASYKMGPVHTDGGDSCAGLNPQKTSDWIGSDTALVEPGKTVHRCQFMEISFFPCTTALATDNHHFPPFQLHECTHNVRKSQPGECKSCFEDISLIFLLLSPHTVFPAPFLVANTSSGFGSGTDTYFKMIAKTNEFFSNIYGNTQNVHSNRWKTEYQIHLFISNIQKKKGKVIALFFLSCLWLAQKSSEFEYTSI